MHLAYVCVFLNCLLCLKKLKNRLWLVFCPLPLQRWKGTFILTFLYYLPRSMTKEVNSFPITFPPVHVQKWHSRSITPSSIPLALDSQKFYSLKLHQEMQEYGWQKEQEPSREKGWWCRWCPSKSHCTSRSLSRGRMAKPCLNYIANAKLSTDPLKIQLIFSQQMLHILWEEKSIRQMWHGSNWKLPARIWVNVYFTSICIQHDMYLSQPPQS